MIINYNITYIYSNYSHSIFFKYLRNIIYSIHIGMTISFQSKNVFCPLQLYHIENPPSFEQIFSYT